jgi:polysaccharide pyruvyl transferase WcaK-like protein
MKNRNVGGSFLVCLSEKYSRVVFSGYYGMSNFGDDLFAYVCASAAKQYWRHTNSSVLSPAVKGIDADYAVPALISDELYSRDSLIGAAVRLLITLQAACRNDLFILGGGSVISSQISGVLGVIKKSVRLTGVEFAALGISIGPFVSSYEYEKARQFLSEFLFISVRDEASYQIAKEFKLSCPIVRAGDLAGLMPLVLPKEQTQNTEDHLVIGVALCRYESIVGGDIELENNRIQALTSAVVKLAKQLGARVVVYSLNNHEKVGDDDVSRLLCTELVKEGVCHTLIRNIDHGVVEVWQSIGRCDFFVSVRLHGAIAAYMNQVPFVLIEYHKKCSDFLDDVGQDEELRVHSSIHDFETIYEVVGHLARSPRAPVFPVVKYVKRALQHFSMLPTCHN